MIVKNVQNVYRFNERINDILNNSKLILCNYQITNDYEEVINYIAYIHNFILENYKYNEGAIAYKTINSGMFSIFGLHFLYILFPCTVET